MKKLIISLLMGAMTLTVAAQTQTKVDDLSFHCQIEGQDITFPCMWSDLEQRGWSFSRGEDSVEVILPTSNLLLLDKKEITVLSPQKRKVKMIFCNVSDKELTCVQSMVYGISYTPDGTSDTIYDFTLSSGIMAGVSTKRDVRDTYGDPGLMQPCDLGIIWKYAEPDARDYFFIVVTHFETDAVPAGTVIGFGAMTEAAVGEMIEKAGYAISDEQATEIKKRRRYERNIVSWTKELQLAIADSVNNNPTYIAPIQYALAMENYHFGNFNKAFEWVLPSAEAGDREAQFRLGVMYSHGEGVKQDYPSAASWYQKAALQGEPEAMSNLGDCYHKGKGVEQSDTKAFEWWLKAAQNEFSPIYARLGNVYHDGLCGLKQDYKQAVVWYEKSANSNDLIGIYNLSCMYYNGYGVKRNYGKALEILLDADTEQYYVHQSLGEHYYFGLGVEKDIQRALPHFICFLNMIGGKDAQTNEEYAKEIEAAWKIIRNNPEVKVEPIRTRRVK